MKHYLLSLASMFICLVSFGQERYTNPVIRGNFADPTLLKVSDCYYASATSGNFNPQYPVFKSYDLVNWELVGNVFDNNPEWTKGDFWAPEMVEHNGLFYVYYTARKKSDGISCIGVAVSDRPEGPYQDKGIIVDWGKEAIDSYILEDNGEQYICWKAYGLDNRPIELLACKLSEDGLRMEGEVFSILKDDDGMLCEGQQWLKHGDWYYILYSIRDCCSIRSDYAVSVARSRSLKGPYEKYSGNPILEGHGPIQSIGHGTGVWTDDGRFFYLCHSFMRGEEFKVGRQPALHEMIVDEDGWMVCKSGKNASVSLPVPFEGVTQRKYQGFEDSFDGDVLNPAWVWSINSERPEFRVASGKLILDGQMSVRNGSLDYEFETSLRRNSRFAGISLSAGRSQYRLGTEGGKYIVLKKVSNGKTQVLAKVKCTANSFRFKLDGSRVEAYYSKNGTDWTLLMELERSGVGTGMPGIFAEGKTLFESFCMKPL